MELKQIYCPSHPEVIRWGHVASLPQSVLVILLYVGKNNFFQLQSVHCSFLNSNMIERISWLQFLWHLLHTRLLCNMRPHCLSKCVRFEQVTQTKCSHTRSGAAALPIHFHWALSVTEGALFLHCRHPRWTQTWESRLVQLFRRHIVCSCCGYLPLLPTQSCYVNDIGTADHSALQSAGDLQD